MALHESQSLLVEMQVCRGDEFLGWAAPILRKAFGGSGPAWEEPNLRRVYTRVRPGLIRSEEHTSELQSLMRISYAVFCLNKNKQRTANDSTPIPNQNISYRMNQ